MARYMIFDFLAVIFLTTTSVQGAVPEQDLFPFGPSAGDSSVPLMDDSYAGPIGLLQPFPFFNTSYYSIYISNDGSFSFMQPVQDFTPTCGATKSIMIAPYWADINNDQGLGGATYYRKTSDPTLLDKAKKDIQAAFPSQQISITSLFIGTWYEAPFNWASVLCQKTNETVPRNTFQGILATNGQQSFAIFYYSKLTWTTGTFSNGNCSGLGGHAAMAGYNLGDGKNFYVVPGSCSENVLKLSEQSNLGSPGKWVLDLSSSKPPSGVCSGHGRCQCDEGYDGDDCSLETNWCETPLSEVEGRPLADTICGNRGSCYRTPAGALCLCYAGFTGQFCDQLMPDLLTLSHRCAYNTSQSSSGCTSQEECVPDDLQCLLTPCKNAPGWCLPNPKANASQAKNPYVKSIPNSKPFRKTAAGNSCSNHGHCVCNQGYTGQECESEIDWCSQPVQGFGNNSDPIKNICSNGQCVSTPTGATCVCNPGFTGPFCNQEVAGQTLLTHRCYAYDPSIATSTTSIPVGCGNDQSCVPDNLQCLLSHCENPIGWCLPLVEANLAIFKNILQKFK